MSYQFFLALKCGVAANEDGEVGYVPTDIVDVFELIFTFFWGDCSFFRICTS